MPPADASLMKLRYVLEQQWGETPQGAQLREIPYVSESLKNTTRSNRSRIVVGDRQRRRPIRVGQTGGGDIEFEFMYGAFDDWLLALLMGQWQEDQPQAGTDRLTNGVTPASLTIEKHWTDTQLFMPFTGCLVGSGSIRIQAEEPITGRFSVLGKRGVVANQSVGASFIDAPSEDVYNAVDHVTAVLEGGNEINVRAVEWNYVNELGPRPIVGSIDPYGIRAGSITLTGTLETYFESPDLINKYINYVETSLSWTFSLGGGAKQYTFTIPKVSYVDGEVLGTGENNDVLVRLQWEGYKDFASGVTMIVDRKD